MGTELRGHGSQFVGGDGYFKSVNESTLIGRLMRTPEHCNYYDALQALSRRVQAVLEEIQQDLRTHARTIRFLPAGNRQSLIRLVQGLDELCAMTAASSGTAGECLRILELRDSAASARYADSELSDAVRMLESGDSTLPYTDRVDAVKSASEWGVSYVGASDSPKGRFLESMGRGRDREFFTDVLARYHHSGSLAAAMGRCGRDLGSMGYVQYMEREVLGESAGFGYSQGSYAQTVKEALRQIGQSIQRDIAQGISRGDYMTYENRLRIQNCAEELSRVAVSASGLRERDLKKLQRLEDFDHKIIEINKTGGSYPVEARLEWESGKNVLYLTANVDYNDNMTIEPWDPQGDHHPGVRKLVEDRRNMINAGIKKWEGTYSVFSEQSVQVVCAIVERPRREGQQLNFYRHNFNDRSAALASTWGFLSPWGWTGQSTDSKGIFLTGGSDSDVVSHEFGHMLGVGDLYDDDGMRLPGVPFGTYHDLYSYENHQTGRYDMVMDANGAVTGNDVEMVIRAFQTGQRQNYQTQDFFPLSSIADVSDVLGR